MEIKMNWIIEQGKIMNIVCKMLICIYAFGAGIAIALGFL